MKYLGFTKWFRYTIGIWVNTVQKVPHSLFTIFFFSTSPFTPCFLLTNLLLYIDIVDYWNLYLDKV